MAYTKDSITDKVWNFFYNKKKYSPYAVASLMGNMEKECAFSVTRVQNYSKGHSYERTYTNNASWCGNRSDTCGWDGKKCFVHDSVGYGLFQWTYWSRKLGLLELARSTRTSVGDVETQLQWLISEGETKPFLNIATTCSSVYDGCKVVALKLLKPRSLLYYEGTEKLLPESLAIQHKAFKNRLAASDYYFRTYYDENAPESEIPSQTQERVSPFKTGTNQIKIASRWFSGAPGDQRGGAEHWGLDLHPVPYEENKTTEIYSIVDGVVHQSTQVLDKNNLSWTYGNYVTIKGDNGLYYLYAHMSKRSVSVGDTVKKGQVIGNMGTTGYSTGHHLHFEVRINNKWQNANKEPTLAALGLPNKTGTFSLDDPAITYDSYGSYGSSDSDEPPPSYVLENDIAIAGKKTDNSYDPSQYTLSNIATSETLNVDNSDRGIENLPKGTNLLTFPSLVETPFIIAKIGEYTFGDHSVRKNGNVHETTFPNFMECLEIVKINGDVNKYTLQMVYQISPGNDPNMLDKVFGSISKTRNITLSYGDWSCPSIFYKEEEAIITKVESNIDFSGSVIKYTIKCVSSNYNLKSSKMDFPAKKQQPSATIKDMLKNNTGNILEFFPGMKKPEMWSKFIPGTDRSVEIPAKPSTDPLSYLNFLVGLMSSNSESNLNSSNYLITIKDDVYGEYGGTYFEITEILVTKDNADIAEAQIKSNGIDTYILDIGYPGNDFVTQFSIKNNEEWSILYNYSEKISDLNETYTINDQGELIKDNTLSLMQSSRTQTVDENTKAWWTKVTQFPIEATVTIKGLIRPSILMSYVRINSYFYGRKHISSGLYIITKQTDKISSSGYTTTLKLLRIAGDTILN